MDNISYQLKPIVNPTYNKNFIKKKCDPFLNIIDLADSKDKRSFRFSSLVLADYKIHICQ